MKWEPVALMVGLIVLGVWLVWWPSHRLHGIAPRAGSRTMELRIGNQRGMVEISGQSASPEYRILLRNGYASSDMTEQEFRAAYGEAVLHDAQTATSNELFRLLNITSWSGFAWVCFGFMGQLIFAGRTFVQWVVSEKQKQSVVPELFWWMAFTGGTILFIYFVWRQDLVAVLGQSSGVVIYARNIKLIHKRKKQQARAPAPPPAP